MSCATLSAEYSSCITYRAGERPVWTGHLPLSLLCCSIMQPTAGTYFIIICKKYIIAVFICKEIWTSQRVRVNYVGSLMVSQISARGPTDRPRPNMNLAGHDHITSHHYIIIHFSPLSIPLILNSISCFKLMSYHDAAMTVYCSIAE